MAIRPFLKEDVGNLFGCTFHAESLGNEFLPQISCVAINFAYFRKVARLRYCCCGSFYANLTCPRFQSTVLYFKLVYHLLKLELHCRRLGGDGKLAFPIRREVHTLTDHIFLGCTRLCRAHTARMSHWTALEVHATSCHRHMLATAITQFGHASPWSTVQWNMLSWGEDVWA